MLYYKEYGNPDGKLVVFIHGGFTTNESFIHQYTMLPEYRCIFVDLPNHGQSEYGKKYHFSFASAAAELIQLINGFSPKERIILISHSYGGLTVKILLEKIPDRIEKVVIGSTNLLRTPLFRVYTSKLGCFILWLQNRKRYQKDHITWQLICESQKDAWKNFIYPCNVNRILYCKPPGFTVLFPEKHLAGGLQSGCTVNLTGRSINSKLNDDMECLLLCAEYDIKPIKASMCLWKKALPNARLYLIKKEEHNYFYNAAWKVNWLVKSFIHCRKEP